MLELTLLLSVAAGQEPVSYEATAAEALPIRALPMYRANESLQGSGFDRFAPLPLANGLTSDCAPDGYEGGGDAGPMTWITCWDVPFIGWAQISYRTQEAGNMYVDNYQTDGTWWPFFCDDVYKGTSNASPNAAPEFIMNNYNTGYATRLNPEPEFAEDVFNTNTWTYNSQSWNDASGSMLAREYGLTGPSTIPGTGFNPGNLVAGQSYVWLTRSWGMTSTAADPNLFALRPASPPSSGNFRNWQERTNVVGDGGRNKDIFGTNSGESFIWAAPVSGQYGGQVTINNTSGGNKDFTFGIFPLINLIDQVPQVIRGAMVTFNVPPTPRPDWFVLGVKPQVGADVDAGILTVTSEDSLWYPVGYAWSQSTTDSNDYVVGDVNTGARSGFYYGRMQNYADPDGSIEFDDGITDITGLGIYGPYAWGVNQANWIWDLDYTLGWCPGDTIVITVENLTGTMDLGFALHDPAVGVYQNRSQAMLQVDALGPGLGETATVGLTPNTNYGLPIWSKTFTSGSFQIGITCPLGVGAGEESYRGSAYINAHPNPAKNGNVTFRYGVPTKGSVALDLYDASGRLVKSFNANTDGSEGAFQWSGAPSGVYFYRATGPGLSEMGKVVVTD